MPKWSDLGNLWGTLKEIDVNAIREESERPLRIPCVGHQQALDAVYQLLTDGPQRYTTTISVPLLRVPVEQANQYAAGFGQTDLLILAVDAHQTMRTAELDGFRRLDQFAVPTLVVIVGQPDIGGAPPHLPYPISTRTVQIPNPNDPTAGDLLAAAVFEQLPTTSHLAAARALPGLRSVYARELVNATAFTNATFATASSLPELVPVLNVPFVAADMLVLTKNQALMVYRLGLAHGATGDIQERLREVVPVIGGGFLWRQLARSLVGLIPIWGVVPKVAIAYAGTYTTGITAWRWFANGEIISTDQVKRLTQDALEIGRTRARELIDRAKSVAQRAAPAEGQPGLLERIRGLLPKRNNDPAALPSVQPSFSERLRKLLPKRNPDPTPPTDAPREKE